MTTASSRPRTASATRANLDRYTSQSIAELEDGYLAFAGQRDDGFYADIQAIFDLLKLRPAAQAVDSQGGFNVHTIALNIPIDALGGDQQIVGVYATTSRRRVKVLGPAGTPTSVTSSRSPVRATRSSTKASSRSRTRISTAAPHPKSTRRSSSKYALTPELAGLINALVLGANVAPTMNRTDIAGIFIPDLIKVDLSTGPARLAGGGHEPSDQSRRCRVLASQHLRRRHADELGAARLRQRHRAGRLAERPALRRRRRRHRGDGADQRSAGQPAEDRRARRRQRRTATTSPTTRCFRTPRRR